MTSLTPDIEDIITRAVNWYEQFGAVSAALPDKDGSFRWNAVSVDMLTSADVRLPHALTWMFSRARQQMGTAFLSGTAVRSQLAFWRNPVALRDIRNVHVYVESVVKVRYEPGSSLAQLRVVYYEISRGDDSPEPQYYVTNCREHPFIVSTSELDILFPDWKNRLLIATELGLSTKDCARFVCPVNAASIGSVPLPAQALL